jgi:hypothetical protein
VLHLQHLSRLLHLQRLPLRMMLPSLPVLRAPLALLQS